MCSAEDDLRSAERQITKLGDQIDLMVRLIEDTERGVWTLAELRRKAEDVQNGAAYV